MAAVDEGRNPPAPTFDPTTMAPVEQSPTAKSRALIEHGEPKPSQVVLVTPERGPAK